MDREKLAKVLAMTTSENDNEALAALRMANKMLSGEKMTWGEIFASSMEPNIRVTVSRQSPQSRYDAYVNADGDWTPPHLSDKPVIENMFRTVFASVDTTLTQGSFHAFLTSIHEQFTKHGRLTQGQYQALRRAHGRAMTGYRTR